MGGLKIPIILPLFTSNSCSIKPSQNTLVCVLPALVDLKDSYLRFHSTCRQPKVKVKVTQSRLFATPWTIQSIEFSRLQYWSGQPFPSPGYLPNPGTEPRSPALQADSLPAEPQGNPKNTRVGSLSLLQGIFPTQESNQGLLHCKWILYQLSYEGSPCRQLSKSPIQYNAWSGFPLDCTSRGNSLRTEPVPFYLSLSVFVFVSPGPLLVIQQMLKRH